MDAIVGLARRHGLRVVEDAAHALTTSLGGKRIGSLDSDVCVFSFYANKTITTGEGGMLVTRNPDVAKRARIMRLHGISRDAFDRFTAAKPSWQYEIVAPGFKYNLTDIASAIGIHQLKKAEQFRKRRAEIAAAYNDAFRRLPVVLPPKPPAADTHAWHLYVIQLGPDAAMERDSFIEQMYSRGVGVSVHYIPLHLQPYWRDTYRLSPGAFPVSERVYRRAVSLPIYSKMTDDDVQRVVSAVEELVG